MFTFISNRYIYRDIFEKVFIGLKMEFLECLKELIKKQTLLKLKWMKN